MLYLDLTLPGQENGMRLPFTVDDVHWIYDDYNRGYIGLIGALDTIEGMNYLWSMTPKYAPTDAISESFSNRDIVLNLLHDFSDPIDEVSWDSSTNCFRIYYQTVVMDSLNFVNGYTIPISKHVSIIIHCIFITLINSNFIITNSFSFINRNAIFSLI